MRFDLDMGEDGNPIRGFEPGQIKVNHKIYSENLIISPRLIQSWPINSIKTLKEADLSPITDLNPDVVLIGTGHKLVFPEQKYFKSFYEKNIGFEIMDTSAACRTYNVIMAEGRHVVAAVIVME